MGAPLGKEMGPTAHGAQGYGPKSPAWPAPSPLTTAGTRFARRMGPGRRALEAAIRSVGDVEALLQAQQ
jgi:hypothetical protein